MKKAIEITVTGRVQGVGFRYFVKQKADENGIKGWVKNKNDGSVEIFAEGEEDKLEVLKFFCEQGTSYSIVEQVHVQEVPISSKNEFKIKI